MACGKNNELLPVRARDHSRQRDQVKLQSDHLQVNAYKPFHAINHSPNKGQAKLQVPLNYQ